jgi:homoserine dehydrogenase
VSAHGLYHALRYDVMTWRYDYLTFSRPLLMGLCCVFLSRKAAHLKALTGADIKIAKVCVRDASKKRDFDIPEGCVVTDNLQDILQDDSIDMVVEVMGGTTVTGTV